MRLCLPVLLAPTLGPAGFAAPPGAPPARLPPVEPRLVPLGPEGSPNHPAAGPRPTLETYPARVAQAGWRAGRPTELPVFPRGGHGFRFASDAAVSPRWRALVRPWPEIGKH